MDSQKSGVKKLSKAILEMKFMKKSREKFCKERDEEEGRAMFASEVTEAMRVGGNKFILESSFVPCEGLIMGRISYHGMNPEIESLLEKEKAPHKLEGKDDDDDMEISDLEMARRYTTLVGTINNKFRSKKEKRLDTDPPMRKRPRFAKPEDD